MEKKNITMSITLADRIRLAAVLIFLVSGILDAAEVIKLGAYQGSLALVGAASLLIMAASFVLRKKESRTLRFFRKMVIAAAVLELTLFQLPSYNMIMGDYPVKTIFPADFVISEGNYIPRSRMCPRSLTISRFFTPEMRE